MVPVAPVAGQNQMRAERSRSALPMTLTELNDMAAAANAGVSSNPATG